MQNNAFLVPRTPSSILRILQSEWNTKTTKECRAHLVERTKPRRNLGGLWGYFIARPWRSDGWKMVAMKIVVQGSGTNGRTRSLSTRACSQDKQ